MLNKRIKSLRLNKSMTQKELSEKLGLTPKMISFYELGDRVPPPDVLEKLADIFNVTTDYLLGRTNNIRCEFCDYEYDPLSDYEIRYKFHEKHHQKCHNILIKYGFYYPFSKREEIKRRSDDVIFKIYNHTPSDNDILNACINRIHAFFCQDIEIHNYNLENLSLKETVKDYLIHEKIYQEYIPHNIFLLLLKYFNLTEEDLAVAEASDLTEKDERDIKKDLDSLMEKLSNQEYGPAAYDGEDIPEDDQELFAGQVEIMLRRLKKINKEKYNPNKNKK